MGATMEQLKELKEMLDAGVLTQEEFDAQKKIILADTNKPSAKPNQVAPEPPPMAGSVNNVSGQNTCSVNVMGGSSGGTISPWKGPPPPNPGGSNFFDMYLTPAAKSSNCMEACCCRPCAHAEVTVWAMDSDGNYGLEFAKYCCCPCCAPCFITEARKAAEMKIYKFHLAREGDRRHPLANHPQPHPHPHPHARLCERLKSRVRSPLRATDPRAQMGGSGDPHADVWKYCLWCFIPCVGCYLVDAAEVEELTKNLAVKRTFCKHNGTGAPEAGEMER